MLGKLVVGSTVIAAILLVAVLVSTTPSSVGPVGLLAVFFLLYVIILGLTTAVTWVSSRALVRITRPISTKRPLQSLSLQHAYYYSSIIALGPIMMLAMQSIGALGPYEVALIIGFILVGILYISRRNS